MSSARSAHAQRAAAVLPIAPRVLTGGESPCKGKEAIIDWLSFTFLSGMAGAGDYVKSLLKEWTHEPIAIEEGNGLYGFAESCKFYTVQNSEPVLVAVAAWGGETQRGKVYVSIDGTGCSLVQDWLLVRASLRQLHAKITRLDIAVDALQGEFTVDEAAHWYTEGKFANGGRNPSHRVAGDWLTNAGAGRTLYVGQRKNGKTARIYEKGRQLGNQHSPWVRFETEVHNVDRIIPHDVLADPTTYFAGMYPCAQSIVDVAATRIATITKEQEISLARLLSYCRLAYGKLLYVASMVTPDHEQLLNDLIIEGLPRRLQKTALVVSIRLPTSPPPEGHHHE